MATDCPQGVIPIENEDPERYLARCDAFGRGKVVQDHPEWWPDISAEEQDAYVREQYELAAPVGTRDEIRAATVARFLAQFGPPQVSNDGDTLTTENAYTDLQASFARVCRQRDDVMIEVDELKQYIRDNDFFDQQQKAKVRNEERDAVIALLHAAAIKSRHRALGESGFYDTAYERVADFLKLAWTSEAATGVTGFLNEEPA